MGEKSWPLTALLCNLRWHYKIFDYFMAIEKKGVLLILNGFSNGRVLSFLDSSRPTVGFFLVVTSGAGFCSWMGRSWHHRNNMRRPVKVSSNVCGFLWGFGRKNLIATIKILPNRNYVWFLLLQFYFYNYRRNRRFCNYILILKV